MKLKKLLSKNINWSKSEKSSVLYYANVEGNYYELRMNDFPEEPFFTLIGENETLDLDDEPKNWYVPYSDE